MARASRNYNGDPGAERLVRGAKPVKLKALKCKGKRFDVTAVVLFKPI